MENKFGPVVRKYNGTFETRYNFEDNETIVSIMIAKKEHKAPFEKEIKEPQYGLTFEKVVLILEDDD